MHNGSVAFLEGSYVRRLLIEKLDGCRTQKDGSTRRRGRERTRGPPSGPEYPTCRNREKRLRRQRAGGLCDSLFPIDEASQLQRSTWAWSPDNRTDNVVVDRKRNAQQLIHIRRHDLKVHAHVDWVPRQLVIEQDRCNRTSTNLVAVYPRSTTYRSRKRALLPSWGPESPTADR